MDRQSDLHAAEAEIDPQQKKPAGNVGRDPSLAA